jgi:radical SAM superfamily enzyme YgiQ (UPF0313 family)
MKLFLLQLPIQGHDFFFSKENIPLAASYLQGIAEAQGIDAELLPNPLMSYGSDQAILQFLVDSQPDMVGMSCYLWNVERSLFLARQLKRHLPTCRIVMGGPEINPDNEFLLRHKDFDVGVVGEGEEGWNVILQSHPKIPRIPGLLLQEEDGEWHFSGKRYSHSTPDHWTSPFLSGKLDGHLQRVLWLEAVRGCVHRCAYCYYHKQSAGLRAFSLERIVMEVRRARDKGLEEIVFLDPCFTRHPQLEVLLKEMENVNHDRLLKIHAEANAEAIDPWMAEMMGRVGFTRMEVGLQSTKRSTLRHIRRDFEVESFQKGVHLLRDNGIEVMVDLIAGLPGDHLSDIRRSLDWVLEHERCDLLMLYPLSLISGTELHQRSNEFKIRAMPYPPYFVTRNNEITAPEICQAFLHYENRTEEDISPLEVPPALDSSSRTNSLPGDFCNVINWHTPDQVHHPSRLNHPFAYALTLSLSREVLRGPTRWLPSLREYLKENPFTLLSIEVPYDAFPEELTPCWQFAREQPQYLLDRDYTVPHTPYRSFLIFSRHQGLLWKWPDPRESFPLQLPDGQKIPSRPFCLVKTSEKTLPRWFLNHMSQRYDPLPEIKIWLRPED